MGKTSEGGWVLNLILEAEGQEEGKGYSFQAERTTLVTTGRQRVWAWPSQRERGGVLCGCSREVLWEWGHVILTFSQHGSPVSEFFPSRIFTRGVLWLDFLLRIAPAVMLWGTWRWKSQEAGRPWGCRCYEIGQGSKLTQVWRIFR